MMPLADQAEKISKQYWWSNGGFIFCKINKAEFCPVIDALAVSHDYAFKIIDYKESVQGVSSRLLRMMKNYCNIHDLEFKEK